MTQNIGEQVYIEAEQDTIFKKHGAVLGVTEADAIRRAINRQVALLNPAAPDLQAWEREKAFSIGRMVTGPASGDRKLRLE